MTADEAFEIRNAVLMGLMIGGLGVVLGAWKVVSWGMGASEVW